MLGCLSLFSLQPRGGTRRMLRRAGLPLSCSSQRWQGERGSLHAEHCGSVQRPSWNAAWCSGCCAAVGLNGSAARRVGGACELLQRPCLAMQQPIAAAQPNACFPPPAATHSRRPTRATRCHTLRRCTPRCRASGEFDLSCEGHAACGPPPVQPLPLLCVPALLPDAALAGASS